MIDANYLTISMSVSLKLSFHLSAVSLTVHRVIISNNDNNNNNNNNNDINNDNNNNINNDNNNKY